MLNYVKLLHGYAVPPFSRGRNSKSLIRQPSALMFNGMMQAKPFLLQKTDFFQKTLAYGSLFFGYFSKNLKKPLDKQVKLWYYINVANRATL